MKPLIPALLLLYGANLKLYSQQADTVAAITLSDSILSINKSDTVRQADLVDCLVMIFKIKDSEDRRNERKVRFSLFPTRSSAGGDKTVFTSFNIAFLLGDLKDTKARKRT
jgi:hypothetical protein